MISRQHIIFEYIVFYHFDTGDTLWCTTYKPIRGIIMHVSTRKHFQKKMFPILFFFRDGAHTCVCLKI